MGLLAEPMIFVAAFDVYVFGCKTLVMVRVEDGFRVFGIIMTHKSLEKPPERRNQISTPKLNNIV
jgi:hypothetical protein